MNHLSAPTSRVVAMGVTVFMTLLLGVALGLYSQAQSASAHGSVIAPETRNYGCLQRWGGSEPDQAQDPMCFRTYHENPNAITAWKAVYANNTGDDYQDVIPDGQICSAGGHGETNYAALDRPGPWVTTSIGSNFTVDVYDEARHGADWLEIYVTKQGFDPVYEQIGWDDLELVETTGSYGYQAHYVTDVTTSGYSGRHVVVTVWKASHMDQKYFLCSDVTFDGGTGDPDPEPTPTDPEPEPTDPAAAQVVNAHSDKCIDRDGGGTANGTAIQQWTCDGTSDAMSWTLNGTELTSGGKCLDLVGGGTSNGTKAHLWECGGYPTQEWVHQSDGTLKNPASGRCLDVEAGSTADGARLHLWDCGTWNSQNWTLTT